MMLYSGLHLQQILAGKKCKTKEPIFRSRFKDSAFNAIGHDETWIQRIFFQSPRQWFSTFSLRRTNCRGTDATAGHELPQFANYYNYSKYDRYTVLLRSFDEKP